MYPYQIIIWTNPKEFSEVPKSHWCVSLEPEVSVMVSRGEIASFAAQNRRCVSRTRSDHPPPTQPHHATARLRGAQPSKRRLRNNNHHLSLVAEQQQNRF